MTECVVSRECLAQSCSYVCLGDGDDWGEVSATAGFCSVRFWRRNSPPPIPATTRNITRPRMPSLQHAPSQSRCRKLRPMVIVRMSSWTRLWLALCAIVFAHSGLGQTYQGRELVKATLLADTSAIVPGKPFTAGLLLRMAPAWHTYWKFSGDAGLPTEIKWKLPVGWKVGEIQWPIPLKTNDPGDIQTYGYQDEVLLMQQITPSAKIDNSSVKLSADASWLVCERICIPGSAKLDLDLPIASASSRANQGLFARWRRLLPQNLPETANANWSRAGSDLRLSLTTTALANYPTVGFFPLPPNTTAAGHPTIESRSGNEITFHIPIQSANKSLLSMEGLLVFGQQANGEDRAAWQITNAAIASSTGSTPARGIFTFLFFGFLGGIILNLMPCVLPVISLKIFGFVQHAGQSRQKKIGRAHV